MAQQGQTATVDEMVAQGADQQILQSLAKRESLAEELRRDGIVPSDNLIVDQIRKIQAFFDPITGKFDQKTYEQKLGENQLTPETFQNGLRDETAAGHLAAAVASGLRPPRLLTAAFTDFEFENHGFNFFLVDPKLLGQPSTPTDDQLKALMNAHIQDLTTPATRIFTVARFSAKGIAASMVPDPAEVKKRYDFRKDTLSTPEKRTLVQIPAKSQGEAQAIAAKLASGVDPAAAAKAAGESPINYTDQSKSGVADPKVGDAAFALAQGASSGPIQGQLGWAVVKVIKVTPGHEVSLEEARSKIEDEIKTEMAANKAYEMSQKFQDAKDKGASFADAAKAAGVPTLSVGPVTAQGQDTDGKPTGLSQKLLTEGFALTQGQSTDATQEDKGEYFALQADKVIGPQPPNLDKLRPELVKAVQTQEMQKRMGDKLTGLIARIKKGESMDAVAASVGAKVTPIVMTRAQAQNNKQLRPEELEQMLGAKAGDVFAARAAVVKVTQISPPNLQIAGQSVQPVQEQVARGLFDEISEESGAYAQTKLKTQVNVKLARQAIGASPDAPVPLGPATKGLPAPAKRAQ